MGLYDTVYVSDDVVAVWNLRCPACGSVPSGDTEWQTRSLPSEMVSYFLRRDEAGAIRLYLLDRPSDERFWHAWTEEEIFESERDAKRGGVFALMQRIRGDGHYLPEAYLPQHRRERFMGELPHQWVEIHASCACGGYLDSWIKFCDGIATAVRAESPLPGPGFFDEAIGFDL